MQRTFVTNGEIIEYYCFAFVTKLLNMLYLQYMNTDFYCETTEIKIDFEIVFLKTKQSNCFKEKDLRSNSTTSEAPLK